MFEKDAKKAYRKCGAYESMCYISNLLEPYDRFMLGILVHIKS